MKLEPTVMYFNSDEIENSNGLYGHIVKKVLEQNNLELDDLKPLYMNKVPGAKISGWTSFKGIMTRVLEKDGDMTFSSFRNWAQLLDIKVAASAVSYYGYELPEDGVLLDFEGETPVSVSSEREEMFEEQQQSTPYSIGSDLDIDTEELESGVAAMEMDEYFEFDSEDNSDCMDDDIEEDLERIHNFLNYSLELAGFAVETEQDNQEVAEFLIGKLTEGMDFLDLDYDVTIVSVVGKVEKNYMFFVVTAIVDNKYPVTSTYTKELY